MLRMIDRAVRGARFVAFACALLVSSAAAHAQETICERVKIEIKQELTLERQAFDAEMKINNTLTNASLTEVGVTVKVMDETGALTFLPLTFLFVDGIDPIHHLCLQE